MGKHVAQSVGSMEGGKGNEDEQQLEADLQKPLLLHSRVWILLGKRVIKA